MITFTVRPDGGEPYELTAGSRDVLQWERTTKGKSAATLGDMADMYKVAWLAAKRQGLYDGSLQDFETTVDLETEGDEDGSDEGPDPTRSAR